MQKNAIKDGGSTTMHSKAKGGKKDGLDLKTFFFFVFFKKFWILENSREISLLDLDLEAFSFHFSLLEKSESDFYFTFYFSKRVNQISISLFTSRKEWIRFSFHFSLLEKSESDFHFTFHFSNFKYPLSQDTGSNFGQMTLPALVTNLVTRWRHLH